MTLLKEIEYKEGVKIALWQIDKGNLNLKNISKAERVQEEKLRQKNCIKHSLNAWGIQSEVVYDVYGKPHLNKSPIGLSISHSFQYLVVGICVHGKLGLDLEKIDRPFEKLAHKFVTPSENNWIKGKKDLALIWSGKESLYKVYGRKRLDFKGNLAILENDRKGLMLGQIAKNGVQIQLPINYIELIKGFVLTRVIYKK